MCIVFCLFITEKAVPFLLRGTAKEFFMWKGIMVRMEERKPQHRKVKKLSVL